MSRSAAAICVAAGVVALAIFAFGYGAREPVAPASFPGPEPPDAAESDVALPTFPRAESLLLQTRRDEPYPLEEKFVGVRWSDVPHTLVAAHDGTPASDGKGARRLFIAAVAPELSDADVERLLRDLRARHLDAEVLRIRIFDDEEAARFPTYTRAGAEARSHRIADLLREPGRERMVVRGRDVEP